MKKDDLAVEQKKHNIIMQYLINQTSNPKAFIGYLFTNIWKNYFTSLSKKTVSKVTLSNDDVVLDIGCGGGANLKVISPSVRSGKIYGIDISEMSVKTSIKNNQEKVDSGLIHVSVQGVEELQFDSNYFNVVFDVQSHIYWNNLDLGLSQVYRTLKKNGIFVIGCENDKYQYHLKKYADPQSFVKLLENHGFTDVKLYHDDKHRIFTAKK